MSNNKQKGSITSVRQKKQHKKSPKVKAARHKHAYKNLASHKAVLQAIQYLKFAGIQSVCENKEPYRKLDPLSDNAITLRNTMRGMIGHHVFHMYLGAQYNMNSVGTSLGIGVPITTYITGTGNWSAIASVFDAYTLDHFAVHLTPIGASAGSTLVAFDPDNTTGVTPTSAVMMDYPHVKIFNPIPSGQTLLTAGDNPGFSTPMVFEHSIWPHVSNDDAESGNGSSTGWVDTAAPTNLLGELLVFNFSTATTTTIFQASVQSYCRFRLIH